MYKFGYVSVIGRTNAGKSSLVNALIGEKVAIVTPKTQTTRQNILGILTENKTQIVFMDTPGIHESKNNLDKNMMKNVRSAIAGADVLLYVIDCTKNLDSHEKENIIKYSLEANLILVISKIDVISQKNLSQFLANFATKDFENIKEIIPVSSKNNVNLKTVKNAIINFLPESKEKNFQYDEGLYTDSSVRFMAEEYIREKALLLLNEEIPHGIMINITKFDEKDNIAFIDADLICEKESHKSIILGKGGTKIKQLGTDARKDIENLLGKKVMLKIFVKVIENWRQRKNYMV